MRVLREDPLCVARAAVYAICEAGKQTILEACLISTDAVFFILYYCSSQALDFDVVARQPCKQEL